MKTIDISNNLSYNVINIPPYDLTVPKEQVNEIKLEKPEGKLRFIDFFKLRL